MIESNLCEHGFYIIDNFLEPTDFQSLQKMAKQLCSEGQFRSAKIGRQLDAMHNQEIRTDQICWLDNESANPYISKIQTIARALNQTLFLSLVDFETHFAIYQPGAFYKKHVDQFANNQDRQISCVYYLNEHWAESFGGQLKLYNQSNELITEVFPQSNRFICFKSNLPHEVCETKKIRYSIAGWMKTRSLLISSV